MATYISSDGKVNQIEEMNPEHLINALSKKMREIFYVKSEEEFNEIQNTINSLYAEYEKRVGKFLAEKLENGWK